MSESKHIPEPWKVIDNGADYFNIEGADGHVCEVWSTSSEDTDGANAERIVACVNACESFSNEMLNDDGVNKLRNDRDGLIKENHDLKAELAQKQLEVEAMKAAFDEYKYNAEAGMRLATQTNEALMGEHGKLVEALKELMSIVKIHSEGTNNNFAWAEMDHAKQILSIINPNS